MALSEANVKSVLSGDTIVLHNVNNPKLERTLSLAFVSAPRIKRDGDEVGYTFNPMLGKYGVRRRRQLRWRAIIGFSPST